MFLMNSNLVLTSCISKFYQKLKLIRQIHEVVYILFHSLKTFRFGKHTLA